MVGHLPFYFMGCVMSIFKKRLIVFFLVLSIIFYNFYFSAIKAEAASVVVVAGITAATMAEICLFVGATALAVYGISEVYENREEICRFGKEFIDSATETVEGWVFQVVDAYGQDYVIGSEALQLVRDTEWTVIQGGLPPEGDPNNKDDKDKDKFHIPGDPMTQVAQFTALGAAWFSVNAESIYQAWEDFLNGGSEGNGMPENNVLINNFPQSLTPVDITQQWSGEPFTYSFHSESFYSTGSYSKIINDFSLTADLPLASTISEPSSIGLRTVRFYSVSSSGVVSNVNLSGVQSVYYSDGHIGEDSYTFSSINLTGEYTYNFNFPLFSSYADAETYLKTGTGYEDSLNYSELYRVADWLQQDWSGILLDPLTNIGLTLSQLLELCRQLGIRSSEGLSAEELADILEDALPKLDPSLLPGETPTTIVVNPALNPIYFPDSDAYPDKPPRPVIDPVQEEPAPSPSPDVPSGQPIDYYLVDLKKIFPFCIPFDFYDFILCLEAEPEAPHFNFKMPTGYQDGEVIWTDYEIDLSMFDSVAEVVRKMELFAFIIGLMFTTRQIFIRS